MGTARRGLWMLLFLTLLPAISIGAETVTGRCPTCYAPLVNESGKAREGSPKNRRMSRQDILQESAHVVHSLTVQDTGRPPSRISPPGVAGVFAQSAKAHRSTTAEAVERIQIVRDCRGRWQWQADGQPLRMRQGVAYQPTEGSLHINDYIQNHALDKLMAQLLPDDEAKEISDTFTGRDHGASLLADGFTNIRIYQAPLDDSTPIGQLEIDRFKRVMQRTYQLYGIHVNLGDFLGLYDGPALRQDYRQMEKRVLKLNSIYGSEPWLANLTLGNENDLYLQGAPLAYPGLTLTQSLEEYYETMDRLAAALKEAGFHRPIVLGHGQPQAKHLPYLAGLRHIDAVGFNLFADVETPPGLQIGNMTLDLLNLQHINDLRRDQGLLEIPFVLNEFGQSTDWLATLNESSRAAAFARQIDLLDGSPLIAGRCAFEFTDEAWKGPDENNPIASYQGILGHPLLEQTFSDHREPPADACPQSE